ncbi:DNA-binding protein HU [Anaerobiospirillum thomasii]|uniref:DNA-binding protein HU n=1 Tax=Anaerobiospirillum thomasii TaxID=179995 RepID=A0A2X0VF12_9GAMM|nr:HU family DNA-binding protein [Anaerobiospirillum thomasii]SPT68098.1 DNA-binding protein HU [Anaerobiospirillum thomasii]SPT70560.1 DNA-binding protein HU [Anaerobiospirillum thomasii]
MNKSQLVEQISKKSKLSLKDSQAALNAFIDVVGETLGKGESITLVGFGSFVVRSRNARVGINPRTREEVNIPASKLPAFKAGKPLKDIVNG